MPIYDNDGTASYEIGKLFDNDGTASYQIGKVYDNDGTTNSLIYSAEQALADSSQMKISGSYIDGLTGSWNSASTVKWNCSGFNTLTFTVKYRYGGSFDSNANFKLQLVYSDGTKQDIINTSTSDYAYRTESKTVDMSGKTDAQKSTCYLNIYAQGYCGNWTNRWVGADAIATNVVAS